MTPTAELPGALLSLLNGEDLPSKEGETFQLITVSDDSWPRIALLSVGEIYAPHAGEVRFALWPRTTTRSNVLRTGQATLFAVHAGSAFAVELEARPAESSRPTELALFTARVREVREDSVGYAELTTGVRFRLDPRGDGLSRWARTVASLRELLPSAS